MDCLYVYYRIDLQHRSAAKAAVDTILRQVEARCGIRGYLMQRADDATTWMEVYERVSDTDAFGHTLEEIVTQSGLLATLAQDSKRHIEHFRSADAND